MELGCGPGEVTEVLADLVGEGGSVLALDRSDEVLATATTRLDGAQNVEFARADLNGAPSYLEGRAQSSFDAIAGRRVLMYLEEPATTLAGLRPWLRRGGLVVFEEADATLCPGRVQALPAHDRALDLLDKMLEAEGANRSMGFHLPATFIRAGLQFERIWAEAVVEGQGDQFPLAELIALLSSRLVAAGVAEAAEIDALPALINAEVDPAIVFLSSMRFCAAARNP